MSQQRQQCASCAHPQRAEIDEEIRRGLGLRLIGRRYDLSAMSVMRHSRHMDGPVPEDRPPSRSSEHRSKLAETFGLDVAELYAHQGHACAICGQITIQKALIVDVDETGRRVRGLLCQRCKRALGGFEDSIERLRAAVDYVERPPAPTSVPLEPPA